MSLTLAVGDLLHEIYDSLPQRWARYSHERFREPQPI
jgi:hypothetical protein